ncbi:MAG: DUF4011 domain-containing protein [Bauldia sp.]
MDVRPYRLRRIDELETMFAQKRTDPWFLDDLQLELKHRLTQRAGELARRVADARRELAMAQNPDGGPRPGSPILDLVAEPADGFPDRQSDAETPGFEEGEATPDEIAEILDPPPPEPAEIERLTRIYDALREKLLDLTKRNRMLNYTIGPRARQLQIVDEVLEEVYVRFVEDDAAFRVVALEEPAGAPEDEKTEEFVAAFEHAKVADVHYQTQLEALFDTGRDDEFAVERLERQLRDRIRTELDLPPRPERAEVNRAEHARALGINPNPELDTEVTRASQTDAFLQTLKFPDELERTLDKILDDARLAEQEAGLSTLFLSFGFLEWYESESSGKPRYAPLLLLPIKVTTKAVRGKRVYEITAREGAAETNVSLERFLDRNYGRLLPAFAQDGDDAPSIEQYLAAAEAAIAGLPRWKIRRWMILGNFAFSRIALYEDARRDRWPNLFTHPLVTPLLAGYERSAAANSFHVPEDYRIDDPEIERLAPILIHDADASQHSALVEVMKSKNLVIEGPPGTGKSQTITNIIANALAKGRTVLFLAEKRAALDVVKTRLDAAGLGEFCLELHSDKSSPRAVITSLRHRFELGSAVPEPPRPRQRDTVGENARADISAYLDALNAKEEDGTTPFQLMWKEIRIRRDRTEADASLDAVILPETLMADASALADVKGRLRLYAETAGAFTQAHGHPSASPWALTPPPELPAFDRAPFLASLRALRNAAIALFRVIEEQRPLGAEGKGAADALIAADLALGEPPPAQLLVAIKGLDVVALERTLDLQATALETAAALAEFPALEIDGETLARATELAERAGSRLAAGTPTELFARADGALARHRQFVEAFAPMAPAVEMLGSGGSTPSGLVPAIAEAVVAADKIRPASVPHLRLKDVDETTFAALRARADALQREEETLRRLHPAYREPAWPAPEELEAAVAGLRKGGFSKLFGQKPKELLARLGIATNASGLAERLERIAKHGRAVDAFRSDERPALMIGSAWKAFDTPFEDIAGALEDRRAVTAHLKALPGGEAVAATLLAVPPDWLPAVAEMRPAAVAFLAVAPSFQAALNNTPFATALTQREADIRSIRALIEVDPDRTLEGYDVPLSTLVVIDAARRRNDAALAALKASPVHETITALAPDVERIEELRRVIEWVRAVRGARLTPPLELGLLSFEPGVWRAKLHESARLRAATEGAMADARAVVARFGFEAIERLDIPALVSHLDRLHDRAEQLADFISMRRDREVLDRSGLADFLKRADAAGVDPHRLPQLFEGLAARMRVTAARRRSDALAHRTGTSLDVRRKTFAELDRLKIETDRANVRARLVAKDIPDGTRAGPVRSWTELNLLAREFTKQGKYTPVRGLLARAGSAIRALTPCFMMSPLSLAKFLPPGEFKFDLLVIDEASQMRPEDALGAMLRARQIVVVGDRKQLPPTAFFDRALAESADDDTDDVDDESILERCQTVFSEVRRLKWHYRCRSESLIRFSNEKFYDSSLITFPAAKTPSFAIDLVRVDGAYQASRNVAEAERVAEEAVAFMRRFAETKEDAFPTLGIVAINTQQRDLIFETLARLARGDELVERYFERATARNEPFFIKNLENVQGDERDVIFISMTYGKAPGATVMAQRFGPINSRHGHRRLNVLFSRARSRIALFASFGADDVKPAETSNLGVRVLKEYLDYVETRGRAEVERVGGEADSDFEIEVSERLRARGYETDAQIGVSGFRIDLGVRHPDQPGQYLAGIECDGARFHASRSARDRDRLREQVLRDRGWTILRVWSTDWFDDPNAETDKLVRRLDELRQKPVAKELDLGLGAAPNPESPAVAEETPRAAHANGSGNGAEGPGEADRVPANAAELDGDGPVTEAEAFALLETFRETVIRPAADPWEPHRSILRDAMIETFIRQRITHPDQWFVKVPLYQRSGTSAVEKRLYLDRIVAVVGRIREGWQMAPAPPAIDGEPAAVTLH